MLPKLLAGQAIPQLVIELSRKNVLHKLGAVRPFVRLLVGRMLPKEVT